MTRSVRFDLVPTPADLQAAFAAGKTRPLAVASIVESDGLRFRVGKVWFSRFGGLSLTPEPVLDNRTGKPITLRNGRTLTQTWLPDAVTTQVLKAFETAHPDLVALGALAPQRPQRQVEAIPLDAPTPEPDGGPDDDPAFD